MKYFIDTEFHEYQKKPLFGKPINTIELISIGIVSEGIDADVYYIKGKGIKVPKNADVIENKIIKKYYAICKEFDIKAAWYANQGTKEIPDYWLRENVLLPIFNELYTMELNYYLKANKLGIGSKESYLFTYKDFKFLINKYGKTKKQIADDILHFTHGIYTYDENGLGSGLIKDSNPEFYAYYADYDWVVFCWLFGRMIDLPKGFPWYCIDLKQTLDEKAPNGKYIVKNSTSGFPIKEHQQYPKQKNEHNALSDAKWNYELYKFLKTID